MGKQTRADAMLKNNKSGGNKKKSSGGIASYLTPVNIIGVIFALFLILALIFMMIPSPPPQPTQAQIDAQKKADAFGEPDQPSASFADDHYMSAASPIQELAKRASDNSIQNSPRFIEDQGITLASGEVIAFGSIEFINLRENVTQAVQMELMGLTQRSVDSETGLSTLMVLDATTNQMKPLTAATTAQIFKDRAYEIATNKTQQALVRLQAQQQAKSAAPTQNVIQEPVTQVIERKVVVESSISDEEKNDFLELIAVQTEENRKLRVEMERLQSDMLAQRSQVVNVMQAIEDSPIANKKLKAAMLPRHSGLKQVSIVGDRVWFTDKNEKLKSYRIGEAIDDTNLIISGVDEGTGVVMVTSK